MVTVVNVLAPWQPVVVLAAYLAARAWARWARGRYSIAELFELPAWYWPLVRYTLRKWKRELHKDVWQDCLYAECPRSTWYITVSGWEWTREGWQVRLQRRPKLPMVRVRVASGFPQGDEEVPPGEKDPRKEVVNQIRGTMDLGPVDYKWVFRLANRHVKVTPKEVVPSVAPGFKPDIAAVVAVNLAADTVVPAIGKGDRPIAHSTTDDASHVLLSGTTMGGGKSETLKTFGVQSYAPSILSGRNIPGADLLIVDTTRKFSHTGWAINYRTRKPWPGIVIATELDDAARYLVYAAQAMEERGRITNAAKLKGETVEWSRLLIMLDDSNGLHQQLKSRGHDAALEAISMLLWHARGVNMYMIAAFQRGSARASGGGDNREAYGCRIWADGSEKTGDMLADAVDKKRRPKPKPHKVQPGHAVFIYGSLAFEAQRIIYTDDEARRVCRQEAKRRMRLALEQGTDGNHDKRGSWLAELGAAEGERPHRGLTYPQGRGHGPAQQTQPHSTLRPQTNQPPAGPGRSPSAAAELSMQVIPAISHIDEDDGEVNYLTMRDLAGRDWCPYTYHSLRSMAKNENGEEFPDPVPGFSNPRRWSERMVREWCDDYTSRGSKAYGVYICWKPGDATAKIGRTGNLRGRLKRWNWHKDWVRRWVPCASLQDSIAMENQMHRDYSEDHEDLEWFRVYDRDGNLTRLGRDLELEEVRV